MTSAVIPNLKSLENQLRDDAVINRDGDHINTRESVHDVVFAMESVIDYNSKNNENTKDSPDSSDDVNTGSFVQSPRLVIAHDVDESSNNSGFSDSMEVSGSYFNYNGDSLSPDHPRNAPVTPIIENGVEKFPCHLCSFCGHSRSQLYDHLDGHFEHKCDQCDYTSRTEGRLKQHIQRFHLNQENINDDSKDGSLSPDSQRYVDGMSSDQLSPTTPNSRTPGRQKVYRCKQCDFTATVKTEFWNHARVHIKDEKLLQCPKCPFVTEYKHHLEYHLRNHFGSKPFKCSKCNYACVNKSMLNSHMKSHTNIYQYRCADCTYATKYCHSLKLHLRKYNHKPSSILNLDGTLDHDTSSLLTMKRSGPKSNKMKEEKDSSPENSFIPQSPSNGVRFQVPPPNMMPFWPLGGSLAAGMRPNPPPLLPLHLSSFFRGFLPPVMQQMQVNPERVENDSKVLDAMKSLNAGQVKLEPGQQSIGNTEILNMFNGSLGKPGTSTATSNSIWPRPDLFGLLAPLSSTQIKEEKHEEMRTDIIKQNHQQSNSGLTGESPLDLRKSSTGEDASPMQDASGRKRSRKGKAYKLDAFCLKLQEKMEADDDDSDNKGSVNGERSSVTSEREAKRSSPESEAASITSLEKVTDQKTSSPSSKHMNQEQNNNNPEMLDGVMREDISRTSGTEVTQDLAQKLQFPFMIGKSADTETSVSYKERYTCNYCDISFSNCVMYTMHMGYHDFKNPFKCNLCGAETTDKVAFFLHIARAAHL